MSVSKTESFIPDFNDAAARRYRNYRMVKDVVIRYLMAVGGISVIGAIVMIALYLVWVVIPLFLPARMDRGCADHRQQQEHQRIGPEDDGKEHRLSAPSRT